MQSEQDQNQAPEQRRGSADASQGGHEDTRGAEPPAQEDAGEAESGGPQGNPEVDEEALQHGQQEAGKG